MATNFWANPTTEPKRQHRFVVFVDKFEPWLAVKVTRPSFTVGEAQHGYLNHNFYYPGKVEWQPVDLTIVDAGPTIDTTNSLYEILLESGYVFPEDPEERSTISKAGAVGSMGVVTIKELDASGAITSNFSLVNAWIQSVSLGEFDYGADGILQMSLTLRYDYAKYGLGDTF